MKHRPNLWNSPVVDAIQPGQRRAAVSSVRINSVYMRNLVCHMHSDKKPIKFVSMVLSGVTGMELSQLARSNTNTNGQLGKKSKRFAIYTDTAVQS